MAAGRTTWTRDAATAVALLAAAMVLVDYEFFGTMAAATGEGAAPPGWVRVPAIPAVLGAVLLWRWPLGGVTMLLAAAVGSFVVAGFVQPTHLYSGAGFTLAALLGSSQRRPADTGRDADRSDAI